MKGQNKNQDYRNAIDSLEGFIQQTYGEEQLSIEESKKNIEQGLVHIKIQLKNTYPPEISSSNGLLITKDGYFLTAKHCVNHNFNYGIIKDRQGRSYQIEKVCAVSKDKSKGPYVGLLNKIETTIIKQFKKHKYNHDLALVKARIDGPPKPMNYRIFNTELLKIGLPVSLLCYEFHNSEMELKKKFGLVKKINTNRMIKLENGTYISHTSQLEVKLSTTAQRGNSGGIIMDQKGEVIGIATNADITGITNLLGGIKISKALELVKFYKRVLMKKLI